MSDVKEEEGSGEESSNSIVLVARKGVFGLSTACPDCLPLYLYLRFSGVPFQLQFDLNNPDSGKGFMETIMLMLVRLSLPLTPSAVDQVPRKRRTTHEKGNIILQSVVVKKNKREDKYLQLGCTMNHVPYVEYGDCVLFNNEKGGVIECLKGEKIVDLDSELPSMCVPDWLSAKALISSWLAEAARYELWMASKECIAHQIYFSDLPWPIGKVLQWKKTRSVKQQLGITYLNATEQEKEIYRKASVAYKALSQRLGEQTFFFDKRPTSLDAIFLGHALFVLHALPDTSILRGNLLQYENLVRYSENLKAKYLDSSSSSSSIPRSPFGPSTSSTPIRKPSYWSSKPKPKAKEKTEEEKTFRRRAKYFLTTQLVAVLVFLSVFGGTENAEDGDEDGLDYED